MGFESIEKDDVLWLNGDVYLESEVVNRIINKGGNVIAVDKKACGDEEVKYKTDPSGIIVEISKKVKQMIDKDKFYKAQEVAAIFNVHVRTVFRWFSEGDLEVITVGRTKRVKGNVLMEKLGIEDMIINETE